MTADPIRAALEAAACALCREAQSCHGDCGGKCAWRDGEVDMPACAAAAVAAFHYKRADDLNAMGREYWPQAAVHVDIAAAVEAAGRE